LVIRSRAASSEGLAPCGPGYWKTFREITVGELAIPFLVTREQSAGSVAVFEFVVPAGARVPAAHSHDGYEETIYGLEGVLTWTIEGRAIDVGPGEALCIHRGAVHKFDNTPTSTRGRSQSSRPGFSARTTSARSRLSSTRQPARPTWQRSGQ
jgi:quercetin dioxygenase-like cupin family protein